MIFLLMYNIVESHLLMDVTEPLQVLENKTNPLYLTCCIWWQTYCEVWKYTFKYLINKILKFKWNEMHRNPRKPSLPTGTSKRARSSSTRLRMTMFSVPKDYSTKLGENPSAIEWEKYVADRGRQRHKEKTGQYFWCRTIFVNEDYWSNNIRFRCMWPVFEGFRLYMYTAKTLCSTISGKCVHINMRTYV